jgi:hypothetical protein
MLDFSRYNLYAMAADPHGSAAVRKAALNKAEIGDEDACYFLKKLADRIDEVASRYTYSQLRDLADKYDKTAAKAQPPVKAPARVGWWQRLTGSR